MTSKLASLFRAPSPKKTEQLTLSGVVAKLISINQDDSFYYVQMKTSEGQLVRVKGLSTTPLAEGNLITAVGCELAADRMGKFYSAETIGHTAPKNISGLTRFIKAQFPDFSEIFVKNAINKFGNKVTELFAINSNELQSVEGFEIGYIDRINEHREFISLRSQISKICDEAGFSRGAGDDILAKFGLNSLWKLENDPYSLVAIKSLNPELIEKFASHKAISEDGTSKLSFVIEAEMDFQLNKGNLVVNTDALIAKICDRFKFEKKIVGDYIERSLQKPNSPIICRSINGEITLSRRKFVESERKLANHIGRIQSESKPNVELSTKAVLAAQYLSDSEQIAAIEKVFQNGVSIITGPPGSGKSTICKIIVDAACSAGLKVISCALSNRAARRIEAVTSYEASTAHKALAVINNGDSLDQFEFNELNPMNGDLYLIDEFSMFDLELSKAYFEAIPSGARVVIVGDVGQIPSVSYGNVLSDLVESNKIAVTYLKTVHRTQENSNIDLLSKFIRENRPECINLKCGGDVGFIQANDPSVACRYVMEKYKKLASEFGEVQVLSSIYGKDLGIDYLNLKIRDIRNPLTENTKTFKSGTKEWREGDFVMSSSSSKSLIGVNGETGFIKKILEKMDGNGTQIFSALIEIHGQLYEHSKSIMENDVDLAYVQSVHKSQGSEYASVILLTPKEHLFMLNRNMLLTGISRGKKHLEIIGDQKTFISAVSISGNDRRTGLGYEISLAMQKMSAEKTNKTRRIMR